MAMADEDNDINSFRLVGNVGLLRPAATPGGLELLNFTVATHYTVWDSSAGKRKEETEWHDVVAFAEIAAHMQQHLTKGTRVEVTGYLRTRNWEDKANGLKHWRRELVAQGFRVLKRGLEVSVPAQADAAISHDEIRESRATGPRVRVF
jgi:single-strand DNA-binding protein